MDGSGEDQDDGGQDVRENGHRGAVEQLGMWGRGPRLRGERASRTQNSRCGSLLGNLRETGERESCEVKEA